MKAITTLALILLIVGGINWGLYGFWNMNLVEMLLGTGTVLSKAGYGLIALSALYKGYLCFCCGDCPSTKGSNNGTGCCSR